MLLNQAKIQNLQNQIKITKQTVLSKIDVYNQFKKDTNCVRQTVTQTEWEHEVETADMLIIEHEIESHNETREDHHYLLKLKNTKRYMYLYKFIDPCNLVINVSVSKNLKVSKNEIYNMVYMEYDDKSFTDAYYNHCIDYSLKYSTNKPTFEDVKLSKFEKDVILQFCKDTGDECESGKDSNFSESESCDEDS